MIRIDHKALQQRLEKQSNSELEGMLSAPDLWQQEAREVARVILERRRATGAAGPTAPATVAPADPPRRRDPWLVTAAALIGLGFASLVFVGTVFGVGPCGTGSEAGDAALATGFIALASGAFVFLGVCVRRIVTRLLWGD